MGEGRHAGDTGTSATLAGDRLPKTDAVFEAGGTLDELSAWLGLVKTTRPWESESWPCVCAMLEAVQEDLQILGAYVSSGAPADLERLCYDVAGLQGEIDAIRKTHAVGKFVLPGAGELEARLHIARTVCRRAERRFLAVPGRGDPRATAYLNRLSDFLFALTLWAREPDESVCPGEPEE